jgi:hypothetical protein
MDTDGSMYPPELVPVVKAWPFRRHHAHSDYRCNNSDHQERSGCQPYSTRYHSIPELGRWRPSPQEFARELLCQYNEDTDRQCNLCQGQSRALMGMAGPIFAESRVGLARPVIVNPAGEAAVIPSALCRGGWR